MSNTLGTVFRVTTFGESHGGEIGAVIDGCPAGIRLEDGELQRQMDRRRPGQSRLTTQRNEADRVRVVSGVEGGITLGSPIGLLIANTDKRPGDYSAVLAAPRPSHADYTYQMKYGVSASSGGGRSSARETAARVAGGAVAEAYLRQRYGVEIVAWVSGVGGVESERPDVETVSRAAVDATLVRCPDLVAAERMTECIEGAAANGDSVGGLVSCVCRGVPVGWGEPVFGKLHALLAGAMLSIPAARGFEIGEGFGAARMRGSEHNDVFAARGAGIAPATNRSGGVLGGISSGCPVYFRVAFKPVASIKLGQETVGYDGKSMLLKIDKGRHDPCVVARAVPVVEAMAALVLADAARLACGAGGMGKD